MELNTYKMRKFCIICLTFITTFSYSQLKWQLGSENFQDSISQVGWINEKTEWGNKKIFIYGNDDKDEKGSLRIIENEESMNWEYSWFYSKSKDWEVDKDFIPNGVGKKFSKLSTGWYKVKGKDLDNPNDTLIQYAYILNVKKPYIQYVEEDIRYRTNCDTLKVTCSAKTSDSLIKIFDVNSTSDSLLINNHINYLWTYSGMDSITKKYDTIQNSSAPILFLTGEHIVRFDTSFIVKVTDRYNGLTQDTSSQIKTIRVNPTFEIIDSSSVVYGVDYGTDADEPGTFTLKNTSFPKRNWNSFEWLITNDEGEAKSIRRNQEETEDDINFEDFRITLKRAQKNTIRLVATSNKGGSGEYCIDTTTVEKSAVFTINDFDLEIPTAFTPDKSINKFFQVYSNGKTEAYPTGILSFKGTIFNRWGAVVYTWTNFQDISAGWDGQIHGSDAPAGTYYYKIEATGTTGSLNKSGALMLIRD
jgi:gliding motility-associated-like protein